MDNETYLKEMAKHAQRNTTNPKENTLNQKKIQVSMYKKTKIEDLDIDSLELYRQMMVDRFGGHRNEGE
jgi:hypothetical protein